MIISTCCATFDCELSKLYHIVTDTNNYAWRSDITKIEIVDPGVRFIEYTKNAFPTLFTVTERKSNSLYTFKLENNNLKGKCSSHFQKEEHGSSLTLEEEIDVKVPFMRIFAKTYLKHQQKQYMKDLKKCLEQK